MKKNDIKKNRFLIRINDDDTLTYFYDLLNSGLFSSQNELLNRCLERGVPEIYKEYFKNYPKGFERASALEMEEVRTQKELKELRLTVDELFVMMNILESLVATIYNAQLKAIDGEPITVDMFESGLLADLPEYLASVKNEMVMRHMKKGGKN